MTPLKLVDQSGDILGAIIVPDTALTVFFREKTLIFYPPIEFSVSFNKDIPPNAAEVRRVVIVPAHARNDAVMLVDGTLWDFEKIPGCFFIPGYAFSQRARR